MIRSRTKRTAMAYVAILPHIHAVARRAGYAIGVHGSLHRDLDLIAVPWTPAAVSAHELVERIAKRLSWYASPEVVERPHGRLSFVLLPPASEFRDRTVYVDLSVTPRSP